VGGAVGAGVEVAAADGEIDGRTVAVSLGVAAGALDAPDGDGLADDEHAAAATRIAIESAAMRLAWRMNGSPKLRELG
jgi:hypothetical protein